MAGSLPLISFGIVVIVSVYPKQTESRLYLEIDLRNADLVPNLTLGKIVFTSFHVHYDKAFLSPARDLSYCNSVTQLGSE